MVKFIYNPCGGDVMKALFSYDINDRLCMYQLSFIAKKCDKLSKAFIIQKYQISKAISKM